MTNPTPAQLAAYDQNRARVAQSIDRILAADPGGTDGQPLGSAVAMCVEAVIRVHAVTWALRNGLIN